MVRQPLEDRLRTRGQCMRGWLVIKPTDKPHIIIGGHSGTDVSDVDLKFVTNGFLSPCLRLKASFRMNGQENPKEHDVYFDFAFDAVTSLRRIPDVQASEMRDLIRQLVETFATPRKRGRWVLRAQYSCESVRSTGFEQAMSMATPAQKAILMGLAQLMEVGEFTIHVRAVKGFSKMIKRWEGFMEKRERDAAHSNSTNDVRTGDIRPRL